MKRVGLWAALVVGALALFAGAGVIMDRFFARGEPDVEVERQQAADSAAVAETKAENRRLLALAAALAESAAVHRRKQATLLASANAKDRRIRELLAAEAAQGDPRATGPGIIALDPLASCEERFQLRTEEAVELRGALSACDQKASADSARADTLIWENARLILALERSDSARRYEITRPRPCRRNLLVTTVSCGTMDLIVAGVSFTGGALVSR